MGELALRCETVASSYVHQPDHSYVVYFMFRLHSNLTHGGVVTGVLHSVWSELHAPPSEYPRVLLLGLTHLCPHNFHKIMYLYSICLVSTTCCDATISQHKRNTNIQELRTLPNTLLLIHNNCFNNLKSEWLASALLNDFFIPMDLISSGRVGNLKFK